MKKPKSNLAYTLGVRVDADDNRRIDEVAAQLPMGRRMDVARAALRLGLAQLEADPTMVNAAAKGRS